MNIKQIIQEEAKLLEEAFEMSYREYVKETGRAFHGSSMKQSTMKQAAFAESMEDLLAMERTFKIAAKAADARNSVHGWNFSKDAVTDLIENVNKRWNTEATQQK